MIKFCAALAALSLAATQAAAAVVDVDNLLVPPPGAPAIGSGVVTLESHTLGWSSSGPAMQTWTVGKTGRLAQVDLFGDAWASNSPDGMTFYTAAVPDFDVTLTILGGGVGLLPGDVVLGSVTRNAADIVQRGVTSFDLLGLDIFATAGTALTLQMSVEGCAAGAYCIHGWSNTSQFNGGGNTYGYAGGREFARVNGILYEQYGDMNFRTWTATPEPEGWALLVMGFLGGGVALRRARAAAAQA